MKSYNRKAFFKLYEVARKYSSNPQILIDMYISKNFPSDVKPYEKFLDSAFEGYSLSKRKIYELFIKISGKVDFETWVNAVTYVEIPALKLSKKEMEILKAGVRIGCTASVGVGPASAECDMSCDLKDTPPIRGKRAFSPMGGG